MFDIDKFLSDGLQDLDNHLPCFDVAVPHGHNYFGKEVLNEPLKFIYGEPRLLTILCPELFLQ